MLHIPLPTDVSMKAGLVSGVNGICIGLGEYVEEARPGLINPLDPMGSHFNSGSVFAAPNVLDCH